MTITLSPDQEQAIRDAIRAGRIASVDEFIEHAIAALPGRSGSREAPPSGTIFQQGLGLFGSPEDAALLDEVVSIAYQERRGPSKRGQAF
jgi:Arc/MetJ-type ribon-helix-helix transcriptional regulator